MTIDDLLKHFGGNMAHAARELRCTRGALWQWKRDGRIPLLRQYQIESLTGGALKADSGEASIHPSSSLCQVRYTERVAR